MKQNEKAIGRSLKEVPTINKIPYPIYDMLEKLSSKWEYILTEGIFRVPGNMTDIIAIKKQYENGESVNLNNVQISTVASLLKNYLKEIPGFLVNNENV
ncbi:RhoGAP domain containing protein [Entamoeba nuttalli P19]|uniref:RhoGAP domain containing protein n=1 Tax=Entamoeba nuttalli (strain P19) TaxID=1076696 RepID=K2H0S0_ENTNP|nr:RhoGAP domain containing protein [Entamoeba nuttalli P19]EKE41073.1 RhoGAP domain containing protein [Entamoeba nuttalli P19]|eukprot:XP_008856580.1 RhoGAP domain containing protein [Entamoeba nuttalli P19]